MNSMHCPKCQGNMMEGFVPDYTHGGVLQTRWVQGTPKRTFWFGIRILDPVFAVTTYRCETCGFLESYATERVKLRTFSW